MPGGSRGLQNRRGGESSLAGSIPVHLRQISRGSEFDADLRRFYDRSNTELVRERKYEHRSGVRTFLKPQVATERTSGASGNHKTRTAARGVEFRFQPGEESKHILPFFEGNTDPVVGDLDDHLIAVSKAGDRNPRLCLVVVLETVLDDVLKNRTNPCARRDRAMPSM